MRINLTSVEETEHLEQIQKMIQSIFPNYSVKVIPSEYANEEKREAIKAYRRDYHKRNREVENQKKREYDKRQRERKQEEKSKDKKEKNEQNKRKREQKTKKNQKSENYAKNFSEYITTRERELNEANDDKQFCKKYCEKYYR